MNCCAYTRPGGEQATYYITVQANEYVISRDGEIRKSVSFPAPMSCTLNIVEERALNLAIDDINRLVGMVE